MGNKVQKLQSKKLLSKDFEIRNKIINKLQKRISENTILYEQNINGIKLKNIYKNNPNTSNFLIFH